MNRPSVEISGNLLSETILDSLAEETSKHSFARPESFKWYKYDIIDSQSLHLSRIAEAYEQSKVRWDMLSSSFNELNISALRDKWIRYLFTQFGYNLEYQKADVVADSGNNFCLSHRGWVGQSAPIVHTVLFSQDLDHKPNDGRHRYSPHDTLQRYLNQANNDLWGIVTNGRELRILRDFHHETRKAYVKFDLELIFEGRNYNDFRLLWRLVHPSRFIAGEDGKCILEGLFEESKNAGVVIGENLQKNVKLAIESLANGFLLSTPELINEMIDNNEKSLYFYQQILQVIYRILFLFYAEQRKLMPTHSALYARDYSLSSLRQKIELREFVDPQHTDLWEGLKVTFQMVYQGVPELGIPAFNGQLFEPQTIEQLNKSRCRNDQLLEAIQYMSVFEKEGLMHRISYIELSVDEIGAIYESLLEYIPRVCSEEEVFQDMVLGTRRSRERSISPRTFFLDPRGTSRKTSGSYYTNPGLVNALIESALVPVLEEKLKMAGPNKDAQEKALLSIKVCDPACGSAAFLIAATECLGERLAKIRIESDYPSDVDIRHARRQVLRHCIYGVDLNPMAVELAKVSLWLTAATSDQPLNFLDHRIKCGNSLIGATPELIKKGIPLEAYSAAEGDDKEISKQRRKLAREYYRRKEREKGQIIMENMPVQYGFQRIGTADLSEIFDESSSKGVREIKETYTKNREKEEFLKNKFIADYWCSAFLWRHDNEGEDYPRPEGLKYLFGDKELEVSESLNEKISQIAKDYKFFHWHLEFPEVFASGGFDCVLGNPPWELLQLQEQELFEIYDPKIAGLSGVDRKNAIEDLSLKNSELAEIFDREKNKVAVQNRFIKNSGRAPLTARGKTNTYSVFVEISRSLIARKGRLGCIVPTAIATDESNKNFIKELIARKSLVSFFDFTNRGYLFPDTESTFSFALITLSNIDVSKISFAAQLWQVEHLKGNRLYSLSFSDILIINPNTCNLPIFRSSRDAEIVLSLHKKFTILQTDVNEGTNCWDIQFRQGLFNMTSDSSLFMKKDKLESLGCILQRNNFINNKKTYLPLYESKLISQYNHRAATFEGIPVSQIYGTRPRTNRATIRELNDPDWSVLPRYWVDREEVERRIPENWKFSWLMGFRNAVSAVADSRSGIAAVIPRVGVGNSMPLLFLGHSARENCLFFANFNSFILDYVIKQKVSGGNLNFYIVRQLPLIPLHFYRAGIIDYICDRVLELVYTSNDMQGFAKDLGFVGEPFKWDEERRLALKTDLDIIFAHLYGMMKSDLEYILDNFDVYARKDIDKHGEFRTKRLILEKYEELKPMFK